MMKISKSSGLHVKNLVKIGKQHWFYENWIDERYLKNTLAKKGFHYTAFLNGKIVGGIMAVEEDYPKFWLYFMAVSKKHQRKGIGTALLKSVETNLKRKNWLFVDLERKDATGLNFYRKNGFKTVGKVNNWFENNKTGTVMAKEIK